MPRRQRALADQQAAVVGVVVDRAGDRVAGGNDRADAGAGDQPGLEIEAGREIKPGMGRAGEAVDAAMLAAPIGIDRAVEGNVGRLIAGDDAARPFHLYLGAEGRHVL